LVPGDVFTRYQRPCLYNPSPSSSSAKSSPNLFVATTATASTPILALPSPSFAAHRRSVVPPSPVALLRARSSSALARADGPPLLRPRLRRHLRQRRLQVTPRARPGWETPSCHRPRPLRCSRHPRSPSRPASTPRAALSPAAASTSTPPPPTRRRLAPHHRAGDSPPSTAPCSAPARADDVRNGGAAARRPFFLYCFIYLYILYN